jgi:F-box/leucine-rich repeat protein 10/11
MKSCAFCTNKTDDNNESEDKDLWIGCDACKEWFHALCVGLNGQEEIDQIGNFYCPNCIATHGPINCMYIQPCIDILLLTCF